MLSLVSEASISTARRIRDKQGLMQSGRKWRGVDGGGEEERNSEAEREEEGGGGCLCCEEGL